MTDEQAVAPEAPWRLALKMLAPYIAVLVFWVGMSNAWLAILAYHGQIVLWQLAERTDPGALKPNRWLWLAAPSVLAGPVVYLLLPYITDVELAAWLSAHWVTGVGFAAMVVYFGILHPPLEQLHWAPLRERTPFAHVAFAGYHVIVLYTLLPPLWLAASFVVLAGASMMWQQLQRRSGGLLVPIASHALADFSIVLVAFLTI